MHTPLAPSPTALSDRSPADPLPPAPLSYAAYVGLDWGDYRHAFALQAADSLTPPETGQFDHGAEQLHTWLDALCSRFGGQPIAIALEASRGPVVAALLEHPTITVFPIHPATSANFRRAFRPSGASDDVPDALVLLDLLRHHRDRLTSLLPLDLQTQELQLHCEARRKAVDRITLLTNSVTSLLKGSYPQALAMLGDRLAAPLALDFLTRWPTLARLQKAKAATLRKFYHAHNVRRPESIEARLALAAAARPLSTNPAILGVNELSLALLVAELRVLVTHVERFNHAIATLFSAHPERVVFASLPGAGKALAPRLCAAFGTQHERFTSAASVQRYVGVAPVTEKRGKSVYTHWRWSAPAFLRQSFVEWAGQSVRSCLWAKAFYLHAKARGKAHSTILRALAFRWIRFVYRCWQTGTPYDDGRYLQALKKSGSPLPALIEKLTVQLAKT